MILPELFTEEAGQPSKDIQLPVAYVYTMPELAPPSLHPIHVLRYPSTPMGTCYQYSLHPLRCVPGRVTGIKRVLGALVLRLDPAPKSGRVPASSALHGVLPEWPAADAKTLTALLKLVDAAAVQVSVLGRW